MAPVVFLDLDSTLLDHSRNRTAVAATCQHIATREPALAPDDLRQAIETVWPQYRAENETAWLTGTVDSLAISREAWRRSLALCGCRSPAVAETAVRFFDQTVRQGYRLYADVPDCIGALRASGVPLALITNGPSDLQRNKLEVLGIAHWFDVIVISGEVGKAKPDPATFAIALRRMHADPADAWHVGDSLEADVVGARAAGLTAVWLNRHGASRDANDPQPHCAIGTLWALPALLNLRQAHEFPFTGADAGEDGVPGPASELMGIE